jgi:hypothetical protein
MPWHSSVIRVILSARRRSLSVSACDQRPRLTNGYGAPLLPSTDHPVAYGLGLQLARDRTVVAREETRQLVVRPNVRIMAEP